LIFTPTPPPTILAQVLLFGKVERRFRVLKRVVTSIWGRGEKGVLKGAEKVWSAEAWDVGYIRNGPLLYDIMFNIALQDIMILNLFLKRLKQNAMSSLPNA
jgi:hypothetical protein